MHFEHSRPMELLENVGDDKEIFLQLVDIFRRESAVIFERMREAARVRNLSDLGRQSHALKGTVGPLGADQLVQMLLDIEDECKRGDCVCDEFRLTGVEDELKSVGAEIEDFINRF
jgi:HPt (histidine-containing phosphotransfer) domain-containing protein